MKLLLCEWQAYMQADLKECLIQMGYEVKSYFYHMTNFEEDVAFTQQFSSIMEKESFDAVVSLNYMAQMALLCAAYNMPYIAWVYDCPVRLQFPEKTLHFPTNHVFFFDRDDYLYYRNMGYKTVHHMELAVNAARRQQIIITSNERKKYQADISFVGNLYNNDYLNLVYRLPDYERGFLNAMVDAQLNLYGAYIIGDVIEKGRIDWRGLRRYTENEEFINSTDYEFQYWLKRTIAEEVTRRERVSILKLLSTRHQVKLYSYGSDSALDKVEFCGTIDDYEDASKVYRCSKINLNITLKAITSGIPLRALEILGSGGFLLTNWQKEIAENFIDGEEVVMYESIEDAIFKADYYLKHEEERERIAENGRRAAERFSYPIQMGRIKNLVYQRKNDC